MNIILISVIVLGVVGIFSATILYFAAQKFKVEEDARIDEIEAVLPGANCGGCGYPGCRGFADACVRSLEGKLCPVGCDEQGGCHSRSRGVGCRPDGRCRSLPRLV